MSARKAIRGSPSTPGGPAKSPRRVGAMTRESPALFKLLGEESGGLILLAAGLGIGVQPAANLAQQLPPRLHRLVNRRSPTGHRQANLQWCQGSRVGSILQMAVLLLKAKGRETSESLDRVIPIVGPRTVGLPSIGPPGRL